MQEEHSSSSFLSRNKTFCNYCPGDCCYRLKGASLYLEAADINRFARHFGITDGEVRRRYLENKYTFKVREDGSCFFLSNDKMRARYTIHTAGPKQCSPCHFPSFLS